MKTKLTVIVDNIATAPIDGEWGLSILVEHGDTMVLVDAGASGLHRTLHKESGISYHEGRTRGSGGAVSGRYGDKHRIAE